MFAKSRIEAVPSMDGLITSSMLALMVDHPLVTVDCRPESARRRLTPSEGVRTRLSRRAFIYARHSTDVKDRREQRQIDHCLAYATKNSLDVFGTFVDRCLREAGMMRCVELQAMLAAARCKRVDVVLVEDIDRLSRSLSDLLAVFFELQRLGIELHDIRTGRLALIHIVIRGYRCGEERVPFLARCKAGKPNAARLRNSRETSAIS